MGVTGLWKLVEPCGKPVPVETLEGKILAIDISIWLHQVVKGFQDSKGSVLPQAHLLGLFHRLCKLLYYRIRPVFVFDGSVPQLKKDTIVRRQQQRNKLNTEAERIQALLLQSLAKEKVVQQALGANVEMLLKSPSKRPSKNVNTIEEKDDLFSLPVLQTTSLSQNDRDDQITPKKGNSSINLSSENLSNSSTSADDSSFDDSNSLHSYNTNLQAIDVHSQHFRCLPAKIRHEILIDIKETRKFSSWGRLHELPSRSDDFSSFQMKRLLKRRAVQEGIEEAEQQMEDYTLNDAELRELFSEKRAPEPTAVKPDSRHLCSDEHARFLLVRNLGRKTSTPGKNLNEMKKIPYMNRNNDNLNEPSTSRSLMKINEAVREKNDTPKTPSNEYDLELAISLSLDDDSKNVCCKKDYEYDSNEDLKLNRGQRQQLHNTAIRPARDYMIEYGGMTDDELAGFLKKTETCDFEKECMNSLTLKKKENGNEFGVSHDENLEVGIITSPSNLETEENQDVCLIVSSDVSETDTTFKIVPDECKTKVNIQIAKKIQNIIPNSKDISPHEEELFTGAVQESHETGKTVEATSNASFVYVKSDLPNVEHNTEKDYPIGPLEKRKKKSEEIVAIIEELRHQAESVVNIKLDKEITANPALEISDDEKVLQVMPLAEIKEKTEIIEICDSEDEKLKTPIKLANFKSPSTKKSVNDYFETKYRVKRTPEKLDEEDAASTKVKSPFFVKKSPARKRSACKTETSHCDAKKFTKASKSLFKEENKECREMETSSRKELAMEIERIPEGGNNFEELKNLSESLAKERWSLETERNRQDRMGMSINQRMNIECQTLLRLFGVPYIVAPMEAEAQCAYLEVVELTNGTITDDSDIWLFGGRTVYKNFFKQDKNVFEFKADQIEQSFNCDRKKLIQLACLVGSDYTNGVHGIGAVTALEILACFSSFKSVDGSKPSHNPTADVLSTLRRFREWWQVQKTTGTTPQNSKLLKLQKKLQNIELHEGFPSSAVIEAYLIPKIDENKKPFSWGQPDVESIHEFTKKTFGWTSKKTDDILSPMLKRLNSKTTQVSIRNYFTTKGSHAMQKLKVSKRVQNAIDAMSGEQEHKKMESPHVKPQKNLNKQNGKDLERRMPTRKSSGKAKRKPILPNTQSSIPQREQNYEIMRKNKEKATEIFKASADRAAERKLTMNSLKNTK